MKIWATGSDTNTFGSGGSGMTAGAGRFGIVVIGEDGVCSIGIAARARLLALSSADSSVSAAAIPLARVTPSICTTTRTTNFP